MSETSALNFGENSLMLDLKDLILVLVDECGDRSEFGRTALQKMGYLSTAALRLNPVGHQAHFYGPFSRQLERTTAQLVGAGYIAEESEALGFVGSGGYQARRFHYRLTESGKRRVEAIISDNRDDVERLSTFAAAVRDAIGGFDQAILSLASKVHYILANGGTRAVAATEIAAQASDLGWRVSDEQVDQVARVLEQLSLVRMELV